MVHVHYDDSSCSSFETWYGWTTAQNLFWWAILTLCLEGFFPVKEQKQNYCWHFCNHSFTYFKAPQDNWLGSSNRPIFCPCASQVRTSWWDRPQSVHCVQNPFLDKVLQTLAYKTCLSMYIFIFLCCCFEPLTNTNSPGIAFSYDTNWVSPM